MVYQEMTKSQLQSEFELVKNEYEEIKAEGLKLNMARGKPGKEQLDMVSCINDLLKSDSDYISDGIDVRNYGNVDGIPAAKRYFADILGTNAENVFVGGNASLQLMYDLVSKAYTHGLLHSDRPWCKEDNLKWLCPAPGYDRHFRVTQSFNFELITIPMTDEGPDMDAVEEYIKDPSVKGIWCVPKYSNPDGIIYSDKTIARLASMKPSAKDFALMWDNAYCIHEFDGGFVPFKDIISECEKYGNADMVYEFASTSKITFPGAGISCMATSKANLDYLKKLINVQTIGYDKINQLRHVMFLKDKENTLALMNKHAKILKPKFQSVLDALDAEIKTRGIGKWTTPKGGYFVSFYAIPGTASRIFSLCKDAGLTMTDAGATYPYGKDDSDSNLRIAPTLPSPEELKKAMRVFCVCVRYASLEKLLA